MEPPPIPTARAWARDAPPGIPLIDLSQAAPALPPPEPLRRAMADAVMEDDRSHLYGAVLGQPELREAVAHKTATLYAGQVDPGEVAITSGCNQAFAAAIKTLAGPGDTVILPAPWYFNHRMWCDMTGVGVIPLPVDTDMLPDPDHAAALIGPRTRAIVLVSPNNPAGTEYPHDLLRAFFDLARTHGIALILDETYRDFRDAEGAPHHLFADPDWAETLIHLYSFSKAYRLTGHRVGAMIAAASRIGNAEKFLDTVTICPTPLGQMAALWGMTHLDDWLAGERAEILARRAAITAGLDTMPDWALQGCGAYFAWATPPGGLTSHRAARALVRDAGVLALPGGMFLPPDTPTGALRLAFANIDRTGIARLLERLRDWTPPDPLPAGSA